MTGKKTHDRYKKKKNMTGKKQMIAEFDATQNEIIFF